MSDKLFLCTFCNTKFVYETNFIKHRCTAMVRAEQFKTPLGQAAWQYYQEWFRVYHRAILSHDAFLSSRYYNSFINFAKHVILLKIPDVKLYIKLMKEKDFSPFIWTNDQVYGLYLQYLDTKVSPAKQASITIKTLFEYADKFNCDISEVFKHLTPSELIQLFRERRISPWLMVFSHSFINVLKNKATEEQRKILESIIRLPYLEKKLSENPKNVELMKSCVEKLNI